MTTVHLNWGIFKNHIPNSRNTKDLYQIHILEITQMRSVNNFINFGVKYEKWGFADSKRL